MDLRVIYKDEVQHSKNRVFNGNIIAMGIYLSKLNSTVQYTFGGFRNIGSVSRLNNKLGICDGLIRCTAITFREAKQFKNLKMVSF